MGRVKPAIIFVFILWLIYIIDSYFNLELHRYGILPRVKSGLIGVIAAPFLHGSLTHLISNSITLLVLMPVLYIFYYPKAKATIFWSIIIGGILVWLLGRSAYHIGASGLIYSIAAYVVFSGIFVRSFKSIIIAIIISVLYQGLIFGVIPVDSYISWEAHLFGAVAGVLMAFKHRKRLPK